MATTRDPVWMGVKAFSLAIAVAFAPHSGAVDASRCYSPRADAPVKTTMRERISSFVEHTTAAATGLGTGLDLESLLDDALDHANSAVESGAGTGYDSTRALETFMTDMRSADMERARSRGEQPSAPASSAPTDNATLTDTFSGGCAERMAKIDADIGAVSEAMDDYESRTTDHGLSACASLIIGYNVTLNYVEALRRCPESDPTGEQLAAQETIAEQMGSGADMICAGDHIDTRKRHSMKDLLDRLTSLTPLDQW